jgi:hypothetical protein
MAFIPPSLVGALRAANMLRLEAGPRAVVALLCGLVVALVVWTGHTPPEIRSDFDYTFVTARAVVRGEDPYSAVDSAVSRGTLPRPYYYPATAPVFASPFGLVHHRLSISLYLGISVGLLAWSLTVGGWWRLWGLLSAPVVHAVLLGQWSPWLSAAIGIPWLGLVWAAKPSIGLAMFAGWPSWKALVGMAVLGAVSLILLPRWPASWLHALHAGPHLLPPIRRPGGFVLLAAFLRWRRPEGRCLGMLALVPQSTLLYEMVPFLFFTRNRRELWLLMLLGYIAAYLVYTRVPFGPDVLSPMIEGQWPYLFGLLYLPALVLVLRLPNGMPPASPAR